MFNFEPGVKKTIRDIVMYTAIGIVVELILLILAHFFLLPDKIPFDYTIFLGAVAGGFVAVLNFVLMAVTVTKVAGMTDDEKMARKILQGSYSKRMLMQIVWIVIALIAPCFNLVAAILPLLFPTMGIKIRAVLGK
ncbi:MAG: ATP synthase subunit I [Lachnospiraceae bacterium]|nr:ATP synthase subunit I [Lachnospiraceae bacterium]